MRIADRGTPCLNRVVEGLAYRYRRADQYLATHIWRIVIIGRATATASGQQGKQRRQRGASQKKSIHGLDVGTEDG
jgi:hypothetical protein